MSRLEDWVWDQLQVEQLRIDAASAAARERSRWRRWAPAAGRSGRRLLIAAAVLAVPGTVGGLALAGALEGQRISPQQWVDGRRVTPERAITAAQSADLGVLRRPRTASDLLLPYDAYAATHSPMAADGVNPQLSRRAEGFSEGGAWLIPGNGTICLTASNAPAIRQALQTMPAGSSTPGAPRRIAGASGNTACATDSQANAGWSAGTAGTAERPSVISTAGIVPDGVNTVTVDLASHGEITLPVHENVYMAELHGWPTSVSFTGPHGPVTLDNGPQPAAIAASHLLRKARAGSPIRDLHVPLHLHLRVRGHEIIGAQLLFTAPYAITAGRGGYEIEQSCGDDVFSAAITRPLARGSTITVPASPFEIHAVANCRRIYSVRVLYNSALGPDTSILSLTPKVVLVGTLSENKPPGIRADY